MRDAQNRWQILPTAPVRISKMKFRFLKKNILPRSE